MSDDFEVLGSSTTALFTLKIHRGDGMALLGMNWRTGKPPLNFVGFAIEYKEPGGAVFFALKNRLGFLDATGHVDPSRLSTQQSPIQKFRWVHFPRNAELAGPFTYRVTPVFMDDHDALSTGEPQQAALELRRETYPGLLNVTFTRGFVSSQAFVDRYASAGPISTLLPANADDGLSFVPTHPQAKAALAWMGFEAVNAILEVLDQAIADTQAKVSVIAYDLSEPEVVTRLEKLGARLRIIIDDDGAHGEPGSGETQSQARLVASAGAVNVKRQHMGQLQHNKIIVVDGPTLQRAVCGSTNYTWRGFYVQNNNALILEGSAPVAVFRNAFAHYWDSDSVAAFGKTDSAKWTTLGLPGIDANVAFSPHSAANALLKTVADDIAHQTTSSLLYSLAFLYQTPGSIKEAIVQVSASSQVFVYGISDRKVGGIDLRKPNGNLAPVYPSALSDNVPEPFKSEPTGGGGTRMHHKFVVIDFDKPTARVYLGSYNFSSPADLQNGENLVLIRDRRIAVSYAIEAVRIFDHYEFRLLQSDAAQAQKQLSLKRPPRKPGEKAWWADDYVDARKVRDRVLFS